jgi:hypothetical protein
MHNKASQSTFINGLLFAKNSEKGANSHQKLLAALCAKEFPARIVDE